MLRFQMKSVINNVVARNNVVNIDFAVGYESMDKAKDVICRAAIVRTLVQIKGIDYVEFSIGGKTMMDSDNTPIGSLTADSFVFGELPNGSERRIKMKNRPLFYVFAGVVLGEGCFCINKIMAGAVTAFCL